ncbi:hypothetical protein B566_EDAN016219, partial [Ephemera danica]
MKTDSKKFSILADTKSFSTNQVNTGVRTPLQILQGNVSSNGSLSAKKIALNNNSTGKSLKPIPTAVKVDKGIQAVLNQVTVEDLTSE